jgi:hypothetical protein
MRNLSRVYNLIRGNLYGLGLVQGQAWSCVYHVLAAHAAAVKKLRSINPAAAVSMNLNVDWAEPASSSAADRVPPSPVLFRQARATEVEMAPPLQLIGYLPLCFLFRQARATEVEMAPPLQLIGYPPLCVLYRQARAIELEMAEPASASAADRVLPLCVLIRQAPRVKILTCQPLPLQLTGYLPSVSMASILADSFLTTELSILIWLARGNPTLPRLHRGHICRPGLDHETEHS